MLQFECKHGVNETQRLLRATTHVSVRMHIWVDSVRATVYVWQVLSDSRMNGERWQQHKLHHMKEFRTSVPARACVLWTVRTQFGSGWNEWPIAYAKHKWNENLFAVNAQISKATTIYDLSNCLINQFSFPFIAVGESRKTTSAADDSACVGAAGKTIFVFHCHNSDGHRSWQHIACRRRSTFFRRWKTSPMLSHSQSYEVLVDHYWRIHRSHLRVRHRNSLNQFSVIFSFDNLMNSIWHVREIDFDSILSNDVRITLNTVNSSISRRQA